MQALLSFIRAIFFLSSTGPLLVVWLPTAETVVIVFTEVLMAAFPSFSAVVNLVVTRVPPF